jgi:hypothetical protein
MEVDVPASNERGNYRVYSGRSLRDYDAPPVLNTKGTTVYDRGVVYGIKER